MERREQDILNKVEEKTKDVQVPESLKPGQIEKLLQEKDNKYKRVEIEEIFKTADFIFPAFSTNNETKKLITDDLINMMNKQYFINVVNNSREIFNHDLMLEKAKEKIVSYAFEIYDGKTMAEYEGNVLASAPYAFYTKESIERLMALWVGNTIGTINGTCENTL